MMASLVYILSSITCIACASLLLYSYRRGGARLLLWSGLCFSGLAINNALATIDVNTSVAMMDLSTVRLITSLLSMGILMGGLAWETT